MNYTKLLEHVKHHVLHFFKTQQGETLIYHNIAHTQEVADHAAKIAEHYQLDDKEMFIVVTAAWFHDIGYLAGESVGHEQRGAEMVKTYLTGEEVNEELISAVQGCIMATVIPQKPASFLEQIVCDADLYHLTKPNYSK